jgi:hypothetical protein
MCDVMSARHELNKNLSNNSSYFLFTHIFILCVNQWQYILIHYVHEYTTHTCLYNIYDDVYTHTYMYHIIYCNMLRCSNIIWCVLLSREVRPQVMAVANSSLGD